MRFTSLIPTLLVALGLALSVPATAAPTKKTSTTKKSSSKAAGKSSKKPAPKPVSKRPAAVAAGSDAAPGMKAAATATALALAADEAAAAKAAALKAAGTPARASNDIISNAPPEAWRTPDPENLVLIEFRPVGQPTGVEPVQVLMELAPKFAPLHVANIRALVRGSYFDGLAVLRVQDNFVTQWADPNEEATARPLPPAAKAKLPAEFDTALAGLDFQALAETDGWTPVSGFVDGFQVGADPGKTQVGRAWLAHCYGVVGAGRGNEIDSSNGSSLYAVIGQPARSLDLNITVVGRILKGIEFLAALPRGTGNMGFYGPQEPKHPIARARMVADIAEADRPQVRVMRTDTPTWSELLHSRRHRGGWFVHSADRVDLCSTTVPVRVNNPK
jgi:cyclophilin family peptidyl-prolyl cis-trans isomerase